VPYYRRTFDDLKISPAQIRCAEDLKKLPIITGKHLSAQPFDFLSSSYTEKTTLELSTTGTTGHFKRIFFNPAALFQTRAAGLRQRQVMFRLLGQSGPYRELCVARSGGTFPLIRQFYEDWSWTPRRVDLDRRTISPSDPFAQNIEAINSFRPDAIVGFASYIGAIYRHAAVNDIEIFCPRVINCGGDTMSPPEKRLLEERFGITVISSFQACESLKIAFQCEERRGFHISLDQVAVRVVDNSGQDVEPGVSGNLLISNLTNSATVLLNYQLGDRATQEPDPCPCGRTLPVFSSFDGRVEDLIVRPGGEREHESVLLNRMYEAPGVLLLQLDQLELQRFVLRVVSQPDVEWELTRNSLDIALRSVLGHPESLSLTIERVDDIKCEPAGKFMAIRSMCTEADS
jgi:phenylacetate-CoA ligase